MACFVWGLQGHVDAGDILFDILDPDSTNRVSYNKLCLCHGLDHHGKAEGSKA